MWYLRLVQVAQLAQELQVVGSAACCRLQALMRAVIDEAGHVMAAVSRTGREPMCVKGCQAFGSSS